MRIQSTKQHIFSKQAILVIACLFCCSQFSFAKLISGYILEKDIGEPIESATVSILDGKKATVSDKKGFFKLELPVETTKLLIKHVSFHSKTYTVNLKDSAAMIIYLEPKSIMQDEVIVSASLYEQTAESIAQSVSVINYQDVKTNMSSNLVDIVATVPGFSQVWEYHSPVILRGMNSERLLIMKDGNRRIGTFPGGYFGQDMNIYDIKKIEIIKGPASVIYGNGAISGIVNVISNDNLGEKGFSGDIYTGYGSNNNEFVEVAKISYKTPDFSISANGKFRTTDNMIYGSGERADNSNVKDRDFALNAYYKISDDHKIKLNATYHYGDWGKPRGFNGPTKYFTKIRNEEESIHTNFSYSYTPYKFIETINLNGYYDYGKRDYYNYKNTIYDKLNTLDLVHYKDNYGGMRAYVVMVPAANNRLTIGTDGYLFNLDNPMEFIDYLNNTYGAAPGYENAGQKNIGAFLNEEWIINEKWRSVAGLRYDYSEVTEGKVENNMTSRNAVRSAVSGNLGIVFSPLTNMHFSANIGRAFRMPTTEELFTTTISCKGIKQGNPNLQPEYGWNLDIGFRGNAFHKKFKYDLSLFYNQLANFIVEYAPAKDNVDIDFTFTNTSAWLAGGELSSSYSFENVFRSDDNLAIGLGLSYVYGVDLSQKEDNAPLFGMPPFKTRIDLMYNKFLYNDFLTSYNIKLVSEIAAHQNRVAKIPENTEGGPWGYEPAAAHCVFDFIAGINFDKIHYRPKLKFIVKNILDTNYKPFGSYIPAMGRNFKIVLMFNI